MISTTIQEALKMDSSEFEDHYLYLVRDGETVFYVGRSKNLLNRLGQVFGYTSPIDTMELRYLYMDNLPQSNAWVFEAFTLSDCEEEVMEYERNYSRNFNKERYRKRYYDPERLETSMKIAQQVLILKYKPCLNTIGNPTPSALPKNYKRR